jgi:hypothetical protein
MRQTRYLILQLQLATLELRQSEIAYGRVTASFGKLVLEHPMLLCEFCELGRCGHGNPPWPQTYRLTVIRSGW